MITCTDDCINMKNLNIEYLKTDAFALEELFLPSWHQLDRAMVEISADIEQLTDIMK